MPAECPGLSLAWLGSRAHPWISFHDQQHTILWWPDLVLCPLPKPDDGQSPAWTSWTKSGSGVLPQRKWNGAGPCGYPGCKSLSRCPLSWLQETGFLQPPWASLSSKDQIQAVVNQGREGTRRQRGNSSAALGQGPGFPSVDTQNSIFELFCRYGNPFQVGEGNYMRPTNRWNQKVDDADSHSPHPQPIRRMLVNWPHPLRTIPMKVLTTVQVRTHSFQGISLLWSFAWQSNKAILYYFTQNFVPEC